MKTGTVKFFNDEKGFGFIVDDENEQMSLCTYRARRRDRKR